MFNFNPIKTLLLWFGTCFVLSAIASPPTTQARLNEWWSAAGDMSLGENGYVIGEEGIRFHDGVCTFDLNEGILLPVFSGEAPVSERMIGMVFIGEGEIEMEFPTRSDAWMFANHMATNANADDEDLLAIVEEGAPFRTSIDRGMLLSSDPQTLKLIYNLEPIGEGVRYTEGTDGIDMVYVVNDRRGNLRAKVVGVNVLANRTRELDKAGLDVSAVIRQDRFLHEQLGFPGDQLRMIGDFRTQTPFRVVPSPDIFSNAGTDLGWRFTEGRLFAPLPEIRRSHGSLRKRGQRQTHWKTR